MAKKASLDILDVEPLEPVKAPTPQDKAPEDESAPAPAALKKPRPLKLWIASGGLAAVILTASVFWFVARDPVSVRRPESIPATSEAKVSGAIADLSRFYVDLKDDQGRIRILACDVRLLLSGRQDPVDLEASPDVRTAIYRAVQESVYARLVDPMGFQYVKANIFSALNRLLGPGVVNEVYLTDFLLM